MKQRSAAVGRTPLILVGVTVLLVVLALILVLTRGTGTPADPRSAEGVVKNYLNALLSGDTKQAAQLLSPKGLEDCHPGFANDTQGMRVALVQSSEGTTTSTVEVLITQTPGSRPFSLNDSGYSDTFQLVKHADTWLIDTAPWPLLACSAQEATTP